MVPDYVYFDGLVGMFFTGVVTMGIVWFVYNWKAGKTQREAPRT